MSRRSRANPSSNLVKITYTSLPVDVPDSFLAPLTDPSLINAEVIDFANTPLPAYKDLYAVVLDNVLSQEECDQLIRLAEQSAGGHNNGWKPAMVNAGNNFEVLAPEYRNSDRIIWDNAEVTRRLFQRVLQVSGMKDYLVRLDGEKYEPVVGKAAVSEDGKRWVSTPQGLNERMRFLKYGAGQYFKPHCDGAYVTPDGSQMTHYTLHLYLNDSAEALGIPEPGPEDTDPRLVDSPGKPAELVRGGATTFYSSDEKRRLDVHPKTGRVLIFQHRKLYHAGDEVKAGIKYTVRSDLMYELEK